ncbi:hypothetical protein B0T22DRAFT_15802 [Podospora appendiculata]|uniref:NAD-dependent epimerase/dehydratase domain-containing protein n=1 Tax=Podospora appendiculata TaxID=314037 RepID=A0AAE0XFI3_9PEZI|nr:hypothetical protein B0T22DRAFT_15802 [Podospora appendiculata]
MSSAAKAKRIVVCGGNGFLGSRICKAAVSRGWDVTSISRSGEPHWASVTSSPTAPAWSHKVTWSRADIFRPAQYVPLLAGADYVVHSMGILLEADYKGVLSGRESPLAGLRKAFASQPARTNPNPLAQGAVIEPPAQSQQQLTYEMVNRDSAILLAKESARAGASAFGYVSAVGGTAVLPARYITTKREAEEVIAREFRGMRSVFYRAPFMYDSSRALTMPMAALTGASHIANGLTMGVIGRIMGTAAVAKPLKADLVAEAVVEALEDGNVSGPVEPAQLEELASKSWRKSMA